MSSHVRASPADEHGGKVGLLCSVERGTSFVHVAEKVTHLIMY